MSLCASLIKFYVLPLAAGVLVLSHALAVPVFARQEQGQQGQEQQQTQQEGSQNGQQAAEPDPVSLPYIDPSARPKPKKVWTNDEVVSLRTPADIYLDEKEAQQAADAEAAAKKAELQKEMKDAGITLDLPSTADATQQSIQDREDRIKDFQQRVDILRHDLPDAPADRKEAMHKQLDRFSSEMRRTQLEVRILRDHLKELNKVKAAEPPPTPSGSPSPPNPE
jgi:hypothetical protein